ncbi:hypothetical protein [Dehalobacterium formicoaceticum]|uniref:Uncharacterized protein n=1 Tax=Dehalobacterium formicoaceticum TaxID=51515 RepID=A0ABT1Y1K9_9FIRM|nr:hypothetical protein [Dehalobacterium formicoaceticum]MCR6544743.1 hypothetical protein [Dehalobacterium formicoaceticum]
MSRRRRRRHQTREREEAQRRPQEQPKNSGRINSLSSLITNVDLRTLSGQLKNVAGYMDKFNQISELFQLADVFVNPKQGGGKGQNFNLMHMLKDKDSLDQLLQMVSPNMRESMTDTKFEKRVDPIHVETHDPQKD